MSAVEGRAPASILTDLRTTPNLLSISRLIGIPVAGTLYIEGYHSLGLILGIVFALTDLIDGWLARRLGQVTMLGAILDRMGDLVFESIALACALAYGLIHPAVLFIYWLREMVVLSARQFVAERGSTIPTSPFGRLKTDFIAFAFVPLFAVTAGWVPAGVPGEIVLRIGQVGIAIGLVFSYLSGWSYLRGFARVYDGARPER